MEKLDGKTMDIVAENVGKLKELFPEAFTEGKVDFEALKEVLGTFVDDRDERYSFTWNGKSKARMIAQTPSTGTLRPCKEESVDWDTTQNIFIEGDNLEVLKLLQKSYHKKVKMIYIDPPYNTGKDFVYKDNFKDNIKNYKEITGQVDGEGRNLSNNPETSGRYHTDWLNMMYPRLKLARNLLKDDGVIFISIDDNEVSNLRKMCDEIFGEENFIAEIVWKKKTGAGSGIKYVFDEHEYVIVYSKKPDEMKSWRIRNEDDGNFKNPDNDQRGPWESCAFTAPSKNRNPNQLFMIEIHYDSLNKNYPDVDSDGRKAFEQFNYNGNTVILRSVDEEVESDFSDYDEENKVARFIKRWAYASQNIKSIFEQNRVYFKDGNVPRFKKFESEYDGKALRSIYFSDFSTQQGTDTLRDLFEGLSLVEYPKPIDLIKHFVNGVIDEGDLVLDFFAGSASTAHGLLKSDPKCRYLLVQLPEKTDVKSEAYKAGYKTIAEISKERIRRSAAKIKEENPEYDGDLGFKVFKLDSTNIKPWEVDFDLTERTLEDFISNIKADRREKDVLYEILLKYGLDLTLPIREHTIAEQKVFDIGMGALVICLSDAISLEVVEGIAKLKDELNPEIMRVVFKDSGFKDDVVKTMRFRFSNRLAL